MVVKKERNWLLVAHCFNMDGRAASQTITDRIPLLLAKGIMPVVLSAPTGTKDTRFPHYRIISPAPSGIRFELRFVINNFFRNSMLQKILRGVSAVLCFPFYLLEKIFIHLDSQWSWFLSASVLGRWLLKKHHSELIYSSAGPPSTHLTAYILHKMSGIPWVAEVHDPLIYEHENVKWHNYYFKKWLEKKILLHAAGFIYFSENALKSAMNRTPANGNGYVIRPGADPPDINRIRYQKRKTIHFGHFGSLAKERNLKVLIQVFHELIQENPKLKKTVRLDIYGAELDPASVAGLREYPLDNVLHAHGRLEYDPKTGKTGRQQVSEGMRQCDVLLLIHGKGEICDEYIPSKLYEYLLMSRPILAVTNPDSELGKMVQNSGHMVVNGDDPAQLKKAFSDLIIQWERDGLPDLQSKSPFTIERAVDNLIQIAADCTAS